MLTETNSALNGILFTSGGDVTADLLTALQQNISNELQGRTKDFVKVPGFAWGLWAVSSQGTSVLVSKGVGIDQNGARLYHPNNVSYNISFPNSTAKTGWLCVKAKPVNVSYRVHPYTGERYPTESLVGLEFFVDINDPFTDSAGNKYPSENNGLILARITVVAGGYTVESSQKLVDPLTLVETTVLLRSSYLKMVGT